MPSIKSGKLNVSENEDDRFMTGYWSHRKKNLPAQEEEKWNVVNCVMVGLKVMCDDLE